MKSRTWRLIAVIYWAGVFFAAGLFYWLISTTLL